MPETILGTGDIAMNQNSKKKKKKTQQCCVPLLPETIKFLAMHPVKILTNLLSSKHHDEA